MLGWTLAGEVLEWWSGYYSVAQIDTTIHKLPPYLWLKNASLTCLLPCCGSGSWRYLTLKDMTFQGGILPNPQNSPIHTSNSNHSRSLLGQATIKQIYGGLCHFSESATLCRIELDRFLGREVLLRLVELGNSLWLSTSNSSTDAPFLTWGSTTPLLDHQFKRRKCQHATCWNHWLFPKEW